MGRHRKYASNADRQRAYRKRNANSQPQGPVTIPWHVDPEFMREMFDKGISVAFLAKKMRVRHCVIRACLALVPAKEPVPRTEAETAEIRQTLETLQELWKKFPELAA